MTSTSDKSFPFPGEDWADRDYTVGGTHFWTVKTAEGWLGVVADAKGMFPKTGHAVTEPMEYSGEAQRAAAAHLRLLEKEREAQAEIEREEERHRAAIAPTDRQVAYCLRLLARLSTDEIFDLECRIGGSHTRPTESQLRALTRSEISGVIDTIKRSLG